jgi:hypothetical protein
MNWQPIETAPKDGTRILVSDYQMGVVIAKWCETCWMNGAGWLVYDDRSDTISVDEPSHWMPLPDPQTAHDIP